MRKITVLSMISLDGVMQAPGGPEEDTSGNFQLGGWIAPYEGADSTELMQKLLKPADLLLGRTTFEIWEHYWPQRADIWTGINDVTKYVVSTSRSDSAWANCSFLNDIAAVSALKASDGPELKVWGSSVLIQGLLKADLVDELWLKIYPLTLGQGKKLFGKGPIPAAFRMIESQVTGAGVIYAHYVRAGEVVTGRVDGD